MVFILLLTELTELVYPFPNKIQVEKVDSFLI